MDKTGCSVGKDKNRRKELVSTREWQASTDNEAERAAPFTQFFKKFT
jgi:hypothetical protein